MRRAIVLSLIVMSISAGHAGAQTDAGVLFLLIPPSTRSWGMGGAGAAVVDPWAGYFNPGGLGVYALDNPVGFAYNRQDWLPVLDLDSEYSNALMLASVPIPIGEESGWPKLSLAIAFHRQVLNFGEIERRDEFGTLLDSFNSFDRAHNFTVALGLEKGLEAGFGITVKSIKSVLGAPSAGSEIGSGEATATARDIGAFVRLPVFKIASMLRDSDTPISFGSLQPAAAIVVSYAWANRGDDINYVDAQQSDPLPRINRFGLSLTLGLDYKQARIVQLLVTRDVEVSKVGQYGENVHREGVEIDLLGILRVQAGRIPEDSFGRPSTYGASFHTRGLFQWLSSPGDEQGGGNIPWFIENLDIFYRTARITEGDHAVLQDTIFHEFGFTLNTTSLWKN